MNATNEDTHTDSNSSHDGFVWGQRLAVFGGFALALALAIARFAPVLAAPLEWQH